MNASRRPGPDRRIVHRLRRAISPGEIGSVPRDHLLRVGPPMPALSLL